MTIELFLYSRRWYHSAFMEDSTAFANCFPCANLLGHCFPFRALPILEHPPLFELVLVLRSPVTASFSQRLPPAEEVIPTWQRIDEGLT